MGTAIPAITNDFHSFEDIAWYEAGFLLPLCMLQLSFGRVYVSKRIHHLQRQTLTEVFRYIIRANGVGACGKIRWTRSVDLDIVLIALVATFEVGSIVCATAPNSPALIVGRAISGIGAAGISSGALILINAIVPLQSRPKYAGKL